MKKVTNSQKLISWCYPLCLVIIGACSDGGEEDSQLEADAGEDVNVLVGEGVTLNGSGSNDAKGNPFEFSWRFIAKPVDSNAILQNNNSDKPGFIADAQGKYKIELTVSNNATALDTVTVSAFDVVQLNGSYDNLFPGPNVGIRHFVVAMSQLIATCEFTEIGGVEAKKIARYNGTSWSALGCGLEDGSIYDMIEYKGELYVTGQFDEIGCINAKSIARWDGAAWHDVEGGLTGGSGPFGHALAIYKDELYVGGQFTKAGNVTVSNIAKWNGSSWSATGTIEKGSVRELQVYKQKLYAGGFFTVVNGNNTNYVAAYDGANWSGLGTLQNLEHRSTGVVTRMAVFDDLLFMAGDFSVNSSTVSELITWDGTKFSDFGRAFTLFQGNDINELATINNVLYIGGDFRYVLGTEANSILQWDGEQWGILDEGVSGTVNSIELFNGKIYVGGDFKEAGGEDADNISIWKKN